MLATDWTRPLLVATAVCLGCGNDSGGPSDYTGPGKTLKVMTRNVYFGAEVDASLAVSTPAQIPPAVAGLWAAVQQSDFPGRAKLIVDEIVAEHARKVHAVFKKRGVKTVASADGAYISPS